MTRLSVVAVAMVAAFGLELLGLPSWRIAPDRLAPDLRRVERLVAAGRFSEALPLAAEMRDRFPREPRVLWQLARVYDGLHRPSDEAAAWEAYLQLLAPTTAVCTRLSDLYRELQQPSQVVAIVDRCLAFDGEEPELLADAAVAQIELGDRRAALSALQQAAAIDPGNPRIAALLKDASALP